MSIIKRISDIFAVNNLQAKNLKFLPRRSFISGRVPNSLNSLELFVNYADGLVYIGDLQGAPLLITELTRSPKLFKEQS